VSQLEVYANKGGFIQGHAIAVIQSASSDLSISNMTVQSEHGSDEPALGELINFTLELENNSESSTDAFTGEIIFSNGVEPNSFSVNIPGIGSGENESLNSIEFRAYSASIGSAVQGQLNDQNGNIICEFVIELELPVFEVSFENNVSPNSTFDPTLLITNFSNATYSNIGLSISSLVDEATVIPNDSLDQYSTFSPFQTLLQETNYDISIEDVAYGSDITFRVEFEKNGNVIFGREVSLHMEPASENLPVAPSDYGYWAYDDTDAGFDHTPAFN
ncbi:uncharacterized protein METZ01_LOCUS415971, partial [marine metagenome]